MLRMNAIHATPPAANELYLFSKHLILWKIIMLMLMQACTNTA